MVYAQACTLVHAGGLVRAFSLTCEAAAHFLFSPLSFPLPLPLPHVALVFSPPLHRQSLTMTLSPTLSQTLILSLILILIQKPYPCVD